MSRVPKWKTEKTKVKVVFRLQFHATHIPQPGWDKLFISFIPADSGKVTAKTNKASVRNGSCKWSDPIYETTRLLLDTKTKKYEEKLYKLVVAMGSSRSNLLGEASINLAEFADALKPSAATLPLHGCDFGTLLHVTVQLLTSKTGFREFEQQRELSVKGIQTLSNQRSDNHDEATTASSEIAYDHKVNARVRFKDDSVGLPSLSEVGELNEEHEDFAGVDGSSYTSDSLYAEKQDVLSRNEVDSSKTINFGDVGGFPINQSPRLEKGDQRGSRLSTQGSIDWTHGWSSDYSGDNDLATAYEENNRLRVRLEVAESAFLQLKLEAKSLQRITNELGAETQSLAQQLLLEIASGEQLVTEVSILKSACSKLRSDLEALKSAKFMPQNLDPRSLYPTVMRHVILDDPVANKLGDNIIVADANNVVRSLQEKWLQDLLLIEGKFQEIQNKTCLGYHENNFNFIHHDFEALGCAIEKLKGDIIQGQVLEKSYSNYSNQDVATGYASGSHKTYDHELIKTNIEASSLMEEKVFDLLHKLEDSKTEKEDLTKKMNQMECYYEGLVLELEESQKQALNKLENLKNEHSSCLYTISVLQEQMDKMHEEMNKQSMFFSGERTSLETQNKELEKRAIASEAALKRVRSNYCIAVDRLQKDLELLSFQVLSMYETNENIAKKAFTDAHQHLLEEHKEDIVAKGDMDSMLTSLEWNKYGSMTFQSECSPKETKDEEHATVNGLSEYVSSKVDVGACPRGVSCGTELHMTNNAHTDKLKNITGKEALHHASTQTKRNYQQNTDPSREAQIEQEPVNLQLLDNALHGKKPDYLVGANGLHSPLEVELSEMHMLNLHLKVFSQVLQEALLDLNDGTRQVKGMTLELMQQLEDTTEAKQSLTLELHKTLDDIKVLRDENSKYVSKYEDVVLKNQILEAKNHDISDENSFLSEKLEEHEKLIFECRAYEDKYNSCIEEKNKYENLLKQECLRYSCLQDEMNVTIEDLKTMKEELFEKSSAYDNMQRSVADLRDKLKYLCFNVISCNEQLQCSGINEEDLLQGLENEKYNDVIMGLKQFQQDVSQRILQISLEKKDVEEMRDVAQCTVNRTVSQISDMKQKYDLELEATMKKLDSSNALVEKLGLELQAVSKKLKFNLEAEKNNALRNEELSSKIRTLEIELQQADDQNKNIIQQLLALEAVKEELEKTQINLMNCKEENESLSISLQSRTEACTQLECELVNLKGTLKYSDEVVQTEKTLRKQLEDVVAKLTSQLEEKDQELLLLHKQKSEADHLHEIMTNLENRNNELENLFSQAKGRQEKLEDELLNISENLRCANEVMQTEKTFRKQLEAAVAKLASQVEEKDQELLLLQKQKAEADHLHETITNLENRNNELENLFSQAKGRQEKLEDDLLNINENLNCASEAMQTEKTLRKQLEAAVAKLTSQLEEKGQELLLLHKQKTEADHLHETITNLESRNKELENLFLQAKGRQDNVEDELLNIDESLKRANEAMQTEKTLRKQLEAAVGDLTTKLEDKDEELLLLFKQKTENDSLHGTIMKLRNTDDVLENLFSQSKETEKKLEDENLSLHTQVIYLNDQLTTILENTLDADIKVTYMISQFCSRVQELGIQLDSVKNDFEKVQSKQRDDIMLLNDYADNEAKMHEENARLLERISSLNSKLEIVANEERDHTYYEKRNTAKDRDKYENEICRLKDQMISFEEEVENLRTSKDALEVTDIMLRSKVSEQQLLLEECDVKLRMLEGQNNALNSKLSDQIMKTEEFRSLSLHLQELRDKAYAEGHQAREKRESDGSSFAPQESLRIAFIKEQYETKIQDMKNQLHVSKKYAEEMLLKLQNSLDEVEKGKKVEVSLAKKVEELSMRTKDLETELNKILTDRRELIKSYDRMKAEMECALLSLDCCKEEKLELEVSLKECSEEKTRVRVELDLVKRLLNNMASIETSSSHVNQNCDSQYTTSIGQILDDSFGTPFGQSMASEMGSSPEENAGNPTVDKEKFPKIHSTPNASNILDEEQSISMFEGSQLCSAPSSPNLQDTEDTLGEELLEKYSDLPGLENHFKDQQKLKASIDKLQKEIEKLRSENLSSVIPLEEHHTDPSIQGLERGLAQLDVANEELGNIFPSFKDLPGSGNALERVLALELELAEALQTKKSDYNVQSSFLKQHNDEEAIFQSFRDINELIQEMLEFKNRYTVVETELKEMQDRYSQLSLQFAEVEGERQKLMMTLKNRVPKKS